MSHPYKTRSGGATVTIFVPYDCRNHCPFCINKKEYADCTGFSVEAILRSIAVMDAITPECDFVFTGGEPFAQLGDLQRMLDAVPGTHKVYINTTFPVQPGCSAEEMIDFTRRNADKITCINVSRHLQRYVEESPDEVVAAIATPKRINCVLYKNYPADKLTEYVERWRKYNIPIQFRYDYTETTPRTWVRRSTTKFCRTSKNSSPIRDSTAADAQRLPFRSTRSGLHMTYHKNAAYSTIVRLARRREPDILDILISRTAICTPTGRMCRSTWRSTAGSYLSLMTSRSLTAPLISGDRMKSPTAKNGRALRENRLTAAAAP